MPRREAAFIEPMECLLVSKLPEGPQWTYEVKLDGYRSIALKDSSQTTLYSRNRKSFNGRFPRIVETLSDIPNDTILDGEVVALDDSGRPDFNRLQNYLAEASRIHYFVFDVLLWKRRDVTGLPLIERRGLMQSVLKVRSSLIRVSEQFDASASEILSAVRQQGLEGVVAKRKDSRYEAGKRTGSWAKLRINRAQELVIGGFIPGPHGVDSIIVGYYGGKELNYVARVRNGFVPASRKTVYAKLRAFVIDRCPFVNLPETGRARWGDILDTEKMKKCVWVRPELLAVIEFLEWTEIDRLRHSRFVALRDDKDPKKVLKEV